MKKFLVVISLFFLPFISISQESYSIKGETLQLKTEVSGNITLLWNIIDGKYRYFIKKDNTITELTNTKDTNHKYQEQYKSELNRLTNNFGETDKLNLTLPSLKNFVDAYNTTQDASYVASDKTAKLETNLLIHGGLTNHPFNSNPENASNAIFGVEIEFYNKSKLPKHALFFGINHALSSDKFDFSNTKFNLGYRFRFINKSNYNIYVNTTIAEYSFSKEIINYYNDNDMLIEDEISGSSLQAPFSVGLGADIKLNSFSFLTLSYNELFALFVKNNGNFSTHLNIGYKINL